MKILKSTPKTASEQKITYVHCSKKQNGEEIKFRGKIIRVYETGMANYRQQEVFVIRLLNNKTIRYRGFCREMTGYYPDKVKILMTGYYPDKVKILVR